MILFVFTMKAILISTIIYFMCQMQLASSLNVAHNNRVVHLLSTTTSLFLRQNNNDIIQEQCRRRPPPHFIIQCKIKEKRLQGYNNWSTAIHMLKKQQDQNENEYENYDQNGITTNGGVKVVERLNGNNSGLSNTSSSSKKDDDSSRNNIFEKKSFQPFPTQAFNM